MQTKYPKKQKTKIISNKTTNNNDVNDLLTEQQSQIDELKTKANKADINNSYFEGRSAIYEKAYSNTLHLQEDLQITNSHACNAHTRIDNLETRVDKIITDGEGGTVDLANLTKTVSNNVSRIRANEVAIYNLQTKDTEQNTDIENINSQIISIQEQLDNNQNTVDLTEVYDLIDLNTQNINNLNSDLGSQIAQNTENIQYLQTDVAELQDTVNMVENYNQNIIDNFDNLQDQVTENSTDIQTLQNQVDINTQKIEALQNDDTNTTELDLIDLTQRVATNEQNIESLKSQQNINTADIATLMLFKQRFDTVPDTEYHPKTYSDFPAGTIVQTYACFERDLNMSGSSSIITPYAYFLAEPESAGTIKLQFDLSTEAETGTITIETFVNKTSVDKIYLDIVAGHNNINHTVYETALNTEGKSNEVYCRIAYSTSVKATLHYFKAELLAPNADIIKDIYPYNIEYLDGTYYVSDCTSGTVKLAKIKADDMYNMDNLQFEDMGIEAQCFNIGMSTNYVVDHYEANQLAYVYLTKDNKYNFYSVEYDKTSTANTNFNNFDFMLYASNNIRFACTNKNTGKTAYFVVYGSNGNIGYGNLSNNFTDVVLTNGFKFLLPYAEFQSLTTYAVITKEGEVILNNRDIAANIFSLGYGTNVRVFLTQLRSLRDYDLKVYIKKYEKLVEYDITFSSTDGCTINSTTEIGTYDDIFIGPRNDYFAVKGGKLSYHFFPSREETTEKTTNTEQTESENS